MLSVGGVGGVLFLLFSVILAFLCLGGESLKINQANDCLLSTCTFDVSDQVLSPQQWGAGRCVHTVPKNSVFSFEVLGNVSVYMFKQQSFLDFKRGGKIASLIDVKRSLDSKGNYTFTKGVSRDDGGFYFVVHNTREEPVTVSYQATFNVTAVPSKNYWPCGNFTTRDSCESTIVSGRSCVWCSNPCRCMTMGGAEDDCQVGWDERYMSGEIVIPDFHFDTWGYLAVTLGGVITLCVVGLFICECAQGIWHWLQKRKPLRIPSEEGYSPLVTN